MAGLRPGLTLNPLHPNVARDSVLISSGSHHHRSPSHADDCVVANDDWRVLNAQERSVLVAAGTSLMSESVSVVDLGDSVVATGHRNLLPLIAAPDAGTRRTDALRRFQSDVSARLFDEHGILPETTGPADLIVHRPNQVSTAFNPGSGVYLGLHIDNHQRLPFGDRAGAMTLFALNLGFAPRYLNFVNLPSRDLVAALSARGVPAPADVRELKSAFLREYPDYPVLRLVLRPGQGYLCNTQDTIHDGATNAEGKPDISFLTLHRLLDTVPRAVVEELA